MIRFQALALAAVLIGCQGADDYERTPPDINRYDTCVTTRGTFVFGTAVTESDCSDAIIAALETMTFPFDLDAEPCDTVELEVSAPVDMCMVDILVLVRTINTDPHVIAAGVASIHSCPTEFAAMACIADFDLIPLD
jgi:hypothetical protein